MHLFVRCRLPNKHSEVCGKMKECPPPWQVLDLISHHLDPKSLASSSCVSKSWASFMSADHLWQDICSGSYPSLANLRSSAPAAVSYRRLYSLGRAAERRRLEKPPKPTLRMDDFFFAIEIHTRETAESASDKRQGSIFTMIKPGRQLRADADGVFRFDINVESPVGFEVLDSLRITWNVVLEDYKGVFTVMDCRGKGSFALGLEGWFSKELPTPVCCSGATASRLVADIRLGLRPSGSNVTVEKISLGVLSIVNWRYVCVDEALRYFQHFLLPLGV